MNGFDGTAREAFNDLSNALESCRSTLNDQYYSLHGARLMYDGEEILDKIDSINKAIRALCKVNSHMEDAGIE